LDLGDFVSAFELRNAAFARDIRLLCPCFRRTPTSHYRLAWSRASTRLVSSSSRPSPSVFVVSLRSAAGAHGCGWCCRKSCGGGVGRAGERAIGSDWLLGLDLAWLRSKGVFGTAISADFCGGGNETRRIPPNATRQTRLSLSRLRPAVHFSTGTRLIREAREFALLSIAILRIARRVDTETNRAYLTTG